MLSRLGRQPAAVSLTCLWMVASAAGVRRQGWTQWSPSWEQLSDVPSSRRVHQPFCCQTEAAPGSPPAPTYAVSSPSSFPLIFHEWGGGRGCGSQSPGLNPTSMYNSDLSAGLARQSLGLLFLVGPRTMSALCPCTVISALTLIFHVKPMSLRISPFLLLCSETQEPLLPEVNTLWNVISRGILDPEQSQGFVSSQREAGVRLAQTKPVTCALISQASFLSGNTVLPAIHMCPTKEGGRS